MLVNNAGISGGGVLDGPTALRVFDTNAVGLVRVTEAALPLLRASASPVVVTVSSSLGSFWAVTNPDRPEHGIAEALYSASKSAVTMLTVQYAKAEPGIRFNAIEPGFTATDLTAQMDGGRRPGECPGRGALGDHRPRRPERHPAGRGRRAPLVAPRGGRPRPTWPGPPAGVGASGSAQLGEVLSVPGPSLPSSSWARCARRESSAITSRKNSAISSCPAFSASRTYWP